MFKKSLFLGIASAILASVVSLIYSRIYNTAMATDFSKVINPVSVFSVCMIAGIIAASTYTLATRWLKSKADLVFNLGFAILSFVTVYSVFSATLPLDVKSPELFPGLATPLHFFPLLAWLVLKPIFFAPTSISSKTAHAS